MRWVSACAQGGCVEVAHAEGRVLVRDSKLGDESPVIEFTPELWMDLLDDIRDDTWPSMWWRINDTVAWTHGGVPLRFSVEEIEAFEEGVKAGRFDVEVKT